MKQFLASIAIFVALHPGITAQNQVPQFQTQTIMAQLTNPELDEISGIDESTRYPNHYWIHNDSGDKPRIFLIDSKGQIVMAVYLKDYLARDWEDITVGPGPDSTKSYVYIGDIGDNNAAYPYKYIYRLPEPNIDTAQYGQKLYVSADRITFQCDNGRRDTETLMIDPLTKDLYIVSKREDWVNVYELPYPQSTTDTLSAELETAILYSHIVGGDISNDGSEIILKSYNKIFYWKRHKGESIAETMQQSPTEIPYIPEPQGEGICWTHNGDILTVSEAKRDENGKTILPPIYIFKRK